MIRPTFYCDECGRIKGDANHWFRAVSDQGTGFFACIWEASTPALSEGDKELHLCSESCLVKAMMKAIGAGE